MTIALKRLLTALNSSTITGEAARKLGCSDITIRSSCLQHGIGSPTHHLLSKDSLPYVPWPNRDCSFETRWCRVFGNDHTGYEDVGSVAA